MNTPTTTKRPLIERLTSVTKKIAALTPHLEGTPDISKLTILMRSEQMPPRDTAIFFNATSGDPVPEEITKCLQNLYSRLQVEKLEIERQLEEKLS